MVCSAPGQEAETTWTNLQGKEIAADFVRLTNTGVVLRLKANGKEAEVPFSMLSIASHYQAMKLGKPEAFSKPLIKAEIPVEVAAPEFTLDPEELLKSPFPDDPTIEQFLSTIKEEVEQNNSFIFWHCLPTKMQTDIALLVEKAVDKIGPGPIAQIRTLMGNVDTIVKDKKEFVLGHPMVAAQPQVVSILDSVWPQLAGLVGALANEEHWQSENFKKDQFAASAANFVAKTAPYATQLQSTLVPLLPPEVAAAASNNEFNYKILSQSKDSAEVEITMGQAPAKTFKLKKLGKVWVPGKEMTDIRKGLDEALANIDQAGNIGSQVQVALLGVNGVVGALAIADSQVKFNETVASLISLAESFAPSEGPGGAGRPGGRTGGRPGRR